MIDTPRIKRLRALAEQISGRPVSEKREVLLREIRGRIVSLETGAQLARGWSAPASMPALALGGSSPRMFASPRLAESSTPLILYF